MDDVFLLYFTMSPPLPPINKQTNKQLTNRGLMDKGVWFIFLLIGINNHRGQIFALTIKKNIGLVVPLGGQKKESN